MFPAKGSGFALLSWDQSNECSEFMQFNVIRTGPDRLVQLVNQWLIRSEKLFKPLVCQLSQNPIKPEGMHVWFVWTNTVNHWTQGFFFAFRNWLQALNFWCAVMAQIQTSEAQLAATKWVWRHIREWKGKIIKRKLRRRFGLEKER